MRADCVIVGGGIVGLSAGLMLMKRQPGLRLILLEKESEIALHQSGRSSGVIHSLVSAVKDFEWVSIDMHPDQGSLNNRRHSG